MKLSDVLHDVATLNEHDPRTLDVIITMALSIVRKTSSGVSTSTQTSEIKLEDIVGIIRCIKLFNDKLHNIRQLNMSSLLKLSCRVDEIIEGLKTFVATRTSLNELYLKKHEHDSLPEEITSVTELIIGKELMRRRLMEYSSKKDFVEKHSVHDCSVCLDRKLQDVNKIVILDGCSHYFCTSCAEEWFLES